MILYVDFQIIKQPEESSTVSCGQSVSLHVSAIGSGQLSYKWKKDGEITDPNCTGVHTAALTISSFSDNSQGDYFCVVKNNNMTIQSNPAKLELSKE